MIIKTFTELNTKEVYEILKARSAVFMIGQNIHYLDMDDVDYDCIHIFDTDDKGKVIAYLRMYRSDIDDEHLNFGRVLTTDRGKGIGRMLIDTAAEYAKAKGYKYVSCDAQIQSEGFYLKCGFIETSEEFIEAGIPHIKMEKNVWEQ